MVVFKIRYKITTKNLNMQEMKRFFCMYQKKEVSLRKISLEGMNGPGQREQASDLNDW